MNKTDKNILALESLNSRGKKEMVNKYTHIG